MINRRRLTPPYVPFGIRRLIIEESRVTNKRWALALEGKISVKNEENIIICSSLKIAEKIFSEPRMTLLREIVIHKQQSIRQLSKKVKRDFKNVYNDIMFLADLGLIELEEHGAQKSLRPIPKYSELELKLAA